MYSEGVMEVVFKLQRPGFGGILQYPDMEIGAGRITFIKGVSGAGKSTLLKLLNGTLSPDEGKIVYKGKDISEMDTILLRKEVILIGQSVYLFDLTIRENFEEYYSYRDLKAPDEETMLKFLALSNADFPLDTLCTTMSGGERQRIYIAICISFLPQVIMLDEPTSALDGVTSGKLMDSLRTFCKGKGITMIIVSHDETLAEKYADDVITIERGEE